MPKSAKSILILILLSVIVSTISLFFHPTIVKWFYTLPYISGWDGAAHSAIMDVYSRNHFPSTWGWLSNWQGGMPFPIYYPPLMFWVGGALTLIFGSSVIAYKIFASLILFLTSFVTLITIIKLFKQDGVLNNKKEFLEKIHLGKTNKNYASYIGILLAIAIILGINTGSIGTRALFFNSMIGHGLSIIFLFPALFSLVSKSKSWIVIGSLSWTLIYLSSIHTALCGLVVSIFIIFCQDKYSIKNLILRSGLIHFFGLMGAMFWLLPMLTTYDYFVGSIQTTPYNIIELLHDIWPHLLISLYGIYCAKNNFDEKSRVVHKYSKAILYSIFLTIILYIIQETRSFNFTLPIYFHRWFETLFFLLVVPYTYAFVSIIQEPPSILKFKKVKGIYIVILFFSLTIIPFIINQKLTTIYYRDHVYKTQDSDNIKEFIDRVAETKKLTMVQSFVDSAHQDILDAEIGRLGGYTTYSNLVESSINSTFFRIARNYLSIYPDIWSLNNFIRSNMHGVIHISAYKDLIRFLGVQNIVLVDNKIDNKNGFVYFDTPDEFNISTTSQPFTLAKFTDPAPFASIVNGDIALFIGDNGFRNREISDIDYVRFNESLFQSGMFNKVYAVNITDTDIEDLKTLKNNSRYTIIANPSIYSLEELDSYINETPTDPKYQQHIVFIYNDGTSDINKLQAKYVRSTDRVVFFGKSDLYWPYQIVFKRISKTSTTTIEEVPLAVNTMNNTLLSIDIPQGSTTNPGWILVRQSHHPGWIAEMSHNNHKTYLSAPGYTIIPIKDSFSTIENISDPKNQERHKTLNLLFPPSRAFYYGHIISLSSYLILISLSIYLYRSNRNKLPYKK